MGPKLIKSSTASEDTLSPFLNDNIACPETKSKIQYKVPTEILQAIFLALATIDDVRAAISTCHRMYEVFKGYENKIAQEVLSRELGPIMPGTFGALAIFVAPRKGPVDEPVDEPLELYPTLNISARYWAPMLREHGELAKKSLTLKIAVGMLLVHREFPRWIEGAHVPSQVCPACVSITLAERDWKPLQENTDGNCVEHLLHANAVHLRLHCRQALQA